MKKLRLIVWPNCRRNCPGCCNKDWDIENLSAVVKVVGYSRFVVDISEYDEIMLTGGEPMLYPDRLLVIINEIRYQTDAPIYVYTAELDETYLAMKVLEVVDGMTVTLHDQEDVEPFKRFMSFMPQSMREEKSLRLNMFKGVHDIGGYYGRNWRIKRDIEWIENCPLPEGEVLMRWSRHCE